MSFRAFSSATSITCWSCTWSTLALSQDGKIERQAVTNLSNFMVEYGLIKKEELPPIDSIINDQFVR